MTTPAPTQPQEPHRQCKVCKETKDPSQFPRVVKTDIFSIDECKHCRRLKTEKRYRDSIILNPDINREVRKKVSVHNKKVRACAKKFCPSIPKENLVEITCPVCNVVFGVTKTVYNGTFNYFGRPPRFCSRRCYHISLTKKWQQKQSPYAKKISELSKVYSS